MRSVLLTATIVLIAVVLPAQPNQSGSNADNLYSQALKTSILKLEKDYGHIDDTVMGERTRTDYRHMVVEKDPLITEGLPTEFEDHSIAYLDQQGLLERYKKLGKPYATLVIRPMRNEGKTLKIAVVVYWVSVEKNSLQLGLSDWSNVEFQYDCDRKQFVVSSVKLDGI
jgi:hypothetical protein